MDYLTTHTSLSPIRRGFAPGFVNYQKMVHSTGSASDKVYQMLPHGRWFSPCTPASSTPKTGRHDIAEILLKVALSTINQSINLLKLTTYNDICSNVRIHVPFCTGDSSLVKRIYEKLSPLSMVAIFNMTMK